MAFSYLGDSLGNIADTVCTTTTSGGLVVGDLALMCGVSTPDSPATFTPTNEHGLTWVVNETFDDGEIYMFIASAVATQTVTNESFSFTSTASMAMGGIAILKVDAAGSPGMRVNDGGGRLWTTSADHWEGPTIDFDHTTGFVLTHFWQDGVDLPPGQSEHTPVPSYSELNWRVTNPPVGVWCVMDTVMSGVDHAEIPRGDWSPEPAAARNVNIAVAIHVPPPASPGFLADVQVLTQPGATGQQTYSLPENFAPKAVILWATPLTADGSVAHYSFGIGFGTYRGSVVQQRYVCLRGLDAAATSDTARGSNSNALLCLLTDSAGSAARNLEIDLISMQSGDTSQVVLDWVNLHSTASIRVFMLVLGGADITDALVDDFTLTTASSTQDETVVSDFGKPELLFMSSAGQFSFADEASSVATSFGFGKQGEAGRGWGFGQAWGNTASLTGTRQRSDRILTLHSNASDYGIASLDTTVGNWPTDGFRLLYDVQPSNALIVSYLALRTTAQITTGANTALTAGSTQDNAAGFLPKLGLVFGWNLVASSALETAAADQCGFGIGAYDGTTEAWAGFTEDDAALTMDSNSQQTIAKVIRNYSPAAALQSEADATFSGNDFRLTWTTLDTVAREYQWLAIGDELPPTIPQAGLFDPHLDARAWF